MEVRILGPVEVSEGGAPVAVEAPKERAIVAVLAANVGALVSFRTLFEALWGEDPPATAERSLQSHVSKLRGRLGAEVIVAEPSGYRLGLDPGAIDAYRFEGLIDAGTAALRNGDPRSASELLGEALDRWRGEPFTDLADGDPRRGLSARFEELRLLASERRIEADLALGRHGETIGELRELVARYPFRESLWAHLMLALYRSGRQAEALRSFQQLRRVLAEELGIEPSAPLVRLEHRILRQDPQLDLEPPPPPHNLPSTLSSFVGRSDDVREVTKAIGEHRMVTLVGPGGVGKTRLALEVARNLLDAYGDGVWWVDLAAVRDPAVMPARVSAVLGATTPPGASVLDGIVSFVRVRKLLIVVDNCEHMAEPVAEVVTRLLEAGSEVGVLATSRVALHLPGEFRRPVEPLELPPAGTAATELGLFASVRLFTDRANERAAPPIDDVGLAAVTEICRRVDGIPLAIELAAARTLVLDSTELLERLTHRLDVLAGDRLTDDPRHRTLRAAIDWSYELLGEREQHLFDQLAVFPGDFDLPAVESVAAEVEDPAEVLDLMSRLVDASMVVPVGGRSGERRFRLLETMTDYGLERLNDDQIEQLRRRHAVHYRRLAREAGAAMDGPHEAEWLTHLEREDHNMRTAITWSLRNEPRTTTLDFANAIGNAWFLWGDVVECRRVLETMLEDDDRSEPGLRAWALYRLLWPALLGGDPDRAFEAGQEATELARLAGDGRLQAALSYIYGHMLLLATADTDAALPHYDEALELCEEHGLVFEKVLPIVGAAQALLLADRPEGVAEMLDEAEQILCGTGDDNRLAHLSMDRALLSFAVDDMPACLEAAAAGVRHGREGHSTNWEQANLNALGVAHLYRGDLAQAEGCLLRSARLALDDGNTLQVGIALQGLSALAAAENHPTTAARLLGASTTLAPYWPLMARRYGPLLDHARDQFGNRFDAEVEAGKHLTPEEAVALALDPADRRL